MSRYKLPNEPAMVSFSGGRSSGYMLRHILDANHGQSKNLHILFANTGKESPETLDFVRDCAENWSCKIVWLEYRFDFDRRKSGFVVVDYDTASRNGEPFEMLIRSKHMLPNVANRFCTEQLKIKTMTRYMRSIGHQDYINIIGLRADEPHRVAKMRARNASEKLRHSIAPLSDAGVTKYDVAAFWRGQSFDLALENNNGTTPLGNCDLCFMKGAAKINSIIRDNPGIEEWWSRQEESIQKTMPYGSDKGNASFIKGLPYRLLPTLTIGHLFEHDGVQCIGCTD